MTIADMRAQWIGGNVEPAWRVTIAKQAFAFSTVRRQYVTVDSQSWLDDFSDFGDQRVMWGDSAQANDGRVLRLWNRSAWGEASAWRYALADGDALALAGAASMRAGSRCGVHNRAAGGWWVYTVDSSNVMRRYPLTLSSGVPVWGSASLTYSLPSLGITPTNVALCPVSETELFVIGFNSPVVWSCYFKYTEGSGWSAGQITPLVERADITAYDATQACAARIGTTDVLAIPHGSGGRHMIVRHVFDNSNIGSSVYYAPGFILASPQEDMGRRVWVQGLNLIDGRLWATVWNELEGDNERLYAGHLALLSSTDGANWTDEGYITQQDVRGKLFAVNSDLWVASPSTVISMPKNARFSNPPETASWEATGASELYVSNGGQRQTAELRITAGNGWQGGVEPGMRVTYELGSYTAPGIAEYTQQFTGFIDEPTLSHSVGVAREEWLARGPLSRLIGETAYRPPTPLWFMGRQVFRTDFLSNGVAAQALAAVNGYWQVDKIDGYGRLRCIGSGISMIPTPWQTPQFNVMLRGKSSGSLGVVVWNADDDAQIANEYYAIELITGTARVIKAKGFGATRTHEQLYAWSIPGYTAGTEIQLSVCMVAGVLQATIQVPSVGSYYLNAAELASQPLNPLGSAPKHIWRAGILAQLPEPTFTGTGANDARITIPPQADASETQLPSRLYRVQISRTGSADAFRWGYQNGTTWVWKETAREITGFTQNLEDGISLSFASKTGHGLDSYWEFQYPQSEAQVYEVVATGGAAPITIQDTLASVAAQAGVPIEFDAPITYSSGSAANTYPFVDDFDVTLRVGANGNFLQVFDDLHILSISSSAISLGQSTQGISTVILPITLRVVYADKVLSVFRGDKPVASWRVVFATPNGRIMPLGTATMTWRPLGIPVEEVMWDYNQPGSSILETVLDRRRIYIYEDPDGVVRITKDRERGWSISPAVPVGSHTAYERAISAVNSRQDARGLLGLVQIIGDGTIGSRVAMLEPRTLQYGARSATIDSPWIRTESAALEEARRVLLDARRELTTRELTGFWDPTLRIGEQFYGPEGWSGIIEAYEHQLVFQQDRISHVARISASEALSSSAHGKWVKSSLYPSEPSAALYPNPPDYPGNNNMPFGPTIAQPPQTTLGKTRWNKFSWR